MVTVWEEKIWERLGEMLSKVEAILTELEDQGLTLDEIDQKLDALEDIKTQLDTIITDIETYYAAALALMQHISDKTDTIDATLTSIKSTVETISTNVAQINGKIDTLNSYLSDIKTNTGAIINPILTIKTDVAAIKADVTTLKTDVSYIKSFMQSIADSVGATAASADDCATLLRDILDLVTTIASDTTHTRTVSDQQLAVLQQVEINTR